MPWRGVRRARRWRHLQRVAPPGARAAHRRDARRSLTWASAESRERRGSPGRAVGLARTMEVHLAFGLALLVANEFEGVIERLDGGFQRPFDAATAQAQLV